MRTIYEKTKPKVFPEKRADVLTVRQLAMRSGERIESNRNSSDEGVAWSELFKLRLIQHEVGHQRLTELRLEESNRLPHLIDGLEPTLLGGKNTCGGGRSGRSNETRDRLQFRSLTDQLTFVTVLGFLEEALDDLVTAPPQDREETDHRGPDGEEETDNLVHYQGPSTLVRVAVVNRHHPPGLPPPAALERGTPACLLWLRRTEVVRASSHRDLLCPTLKPQAPGGRGRCKPNNLLAPRWSSRESSSAGG